MVGAFFEYYFQPIRSSSNLQLGTLKLFLCLDSDQDVIIVKINPKENGDHVNSFMKRCSHVRDFSYIISKIEVQVFT